ncbi:kininogen-1-like isoform X1 [Etheostoma cragini]|uniref:kininogen-1-like isoform X1 n=1 Tax=Etheostoma cragini TaxID=417921 RepID=UPI00155E101B|nr:kininogen-1-like isoform X1 [Etheostoma cragini]
MFGGNQDKHPSEAYGLKPNTGDKDCGVLGPVSGGDGRSGGNVQQKDKKDHDKDSQVGDRRGGDRDKDVPQGGDRRGGDRDKVAPQGGDRRDRKEGREHSPRRRGSGGRHSDDSDSDSEHPKHGHGHGHGHGCGRGRGHGRGGHS